MLYKWSREEITWYRERYFINDWRSLKIKRSSEDIINRASIIKTKNNKSVRVSYQIGILVEYFLG